MINKHFVKWLLLQLLLLYYFFFTSIQNKDIAAMRHFWLNSSLNLYRLHEYVNISCIFIQCMTLNIWYYCCVFVFIKHLKNILLSHPLEDVWTPLSNCLPAYQYWSTSSDRYKYALTFILFCSLRIDWNRYPLNS